MFSLSGLSKQAVIRLSTGCNNIRQSWSLAFLLWRRTRLSGIIWERFRWHRRFLLLPTGSISALRCVWGIFCSLLFVSGSIFWKEKGSLCCRTDRSPYFLKTGSRNIAICLLSVMTDRKRSGFVKCIWELFPRWNRRILFRRSMYRKNRLLFLRR